MAATDDGVGAARRKPFDAVRIAAYWVVVVAGLWWLLDQFAVVLRPLLLAVFLGYVLLPYYNRLRHWLPGPAAIGLLAGLTAAILAVLVLALYASLLGLSDELPTLKSRAVQLMDQGFEFVDRQSQAVGLPVRTRATPSNSPSQAPRDGEIADVIFRTARSAANAAATGLLEAATAGLYLLFLLLGAERLPERVRDAYPADQAEHILDVAGRVNAAIVSYLKAKVRSSLVIAIPVGLVLTAFGVRFAFLWAVMTFLCNFIPYVGSVIAYLLPVGFTFLQLDLGYQPVTVAVLLLACHVASAAVVEPTLIGRAVGLSPLVILAALSIWGLLWGLPGMFLAVPLTVVLKLILENIHTTRSLAKLLGG